MPLEAASEKVYFPSVGFLFSGSALQPLRSWRADGEQRSRLNRLVNRLIKNLSEAGTLRIALAPIDIGRGSG